MPVRWRLADHSKGIQFQRPPLRFEINEGQTDPQVRFMARDRDGVAYLTSDGAVFQISRPVGTPESKTRFKKASYSPETRGFESSFVRMKTVGANPNPRAVGIDRLPGVTNYFIGNDPAKWKTNVAGYAKVKYEGVYPGIDLVYYDNGEGRLEYDFIVAPGADPKQIALSIEDAESVEVDPSGDLVISAATGTIRKPAPRGLSRDRRKAPGDSRRLPPPQPSTLNSPLSPLNPRHSSLVTSPSTLDPRPSAGRLRPRRLRPKQTPGDRPAGDLRDLSRRFFNIHCSERRRPRRGGGRARFGLHCRSHDID